jgi:AhpD family alkylhydroperoxidase
VSPRLEPLTDGADDPDLAPVFDVFRKAGRPVPLLYRTLGHAPRMLRAWTALAWPLRHEATTDRGLRELMIMRVAVLTKAPYEWAAHWPEALRHGVSRQQLESLASWPEAPCFSEAERVVLRCVDEIINDGGATADGFAALREHFDAGECVELVLTASFYACVSRTLSSLGMEPEVDAGDSTATDVFNRMIGAVD